MLKSYRRSLRSIVRSVSVSADALFLWEKGKSPACKPDSVRSPKRSWSSFICPEGYPTGSICLPFPVSPKGTMDEPSMSCHRNDRTEDIHGISARKVYPPHPSLDPAVGSYPTFSPLPCQQGGHFLWHCLFPFSQDPALHRCDALSCPDFPRIQMMRDDPSGDFPLQRYETRRLGQRL